MSATIQTVFNDCMSLDSQRHFTQHLLVPFTLDLTNDDQSQPTDIISADYKAKGSLSFEAGHTLRLNQAGGGKSLGPLVVVPGKLVATVVADFGVGGHGGTFQFDLTITIFGPVAVAGSTSTIDIQSTNFFTYFEADPNASLPLQMVGFYPMHNKNTLKLFLGTPALVSWLPKGPIHTP